MINSNKFIKELFNNQISHLLVVPCSFSKGLINACINNSDLIEYIPCAREAIACSIQRPMTSPELSCMQAARRPCSASRLFGNGRPWIAPRDGLLLVERLSVEDKLDN